MSAFYISNLDTIIEWTWDNYGKVGGTMYVRVAPAIVRCIEPSSGKPRQD
jgi:hypothetical protein